MSTVIEKQKIYNHYMKKRDSILSCQLPRKFTNILMNLDFTIFASLKFREY